jgi:hypothetical protein
VIAFATAGEKSRDAGEPSTPKSEFMRIFVACEAIASPACLAAARSSQSRATSAGRMPSSRANAAPLGVRRSSGPGDATWVSGSRLKVRMRLGYRLVKSNTRMCR